MSWSHTPRHGVVHAAGSACDPGRGRRVVTAASRRAMFRAMTQAFDLSRFVAAQEGTWPAALAELRAGRKATHWMWFIFPQLATLGRSATARYYGIAGLAEARAYLAHPVLGPRLQKAARAVLAHEGAPPEAILGATDALKLRSCATLFAEAGGGPEFRAILDAFYGGRPCPLTLAALGRREGR